MDQTKVFFMPDGKDDPKKTEPKSETVKMPPVPLPPPPQKTNPHKADHSLSILTIMAVLMIALGFSSGFLAYKYLPELAGLIGTSANAPMTNDSDLATPKSSNQTPGEITNWPTYANTAFSYSLKFPDTWYGQNTNNPDAPIVNFTSANPDALLPDDIKVSVSALSANGASLRDWVSANQNGSEIPLTELKIGGNLALQEKTTSSPATLNTYLQSGQYILIISYTTSEAQFTTSQSIYNQILDSIKLTFQSI